MSTGPPQWTRRHWLREAREWCNVRWLDLTSMLRGSSGKFSMFRIVVGGSAIAFWAQWPVEWTPPAVTAFAILVFALPLEELTRRVPVSEALGAVESFFSMLAGRATAKASEYVDRMRSRRETGPEKYGPGPQPPPDPPDGSEGGVG